MVMWSVLQSPYMIRISFREIAMQNQEFNEAIVVADVIGKYQLGIGDGWIVQRIKQFIHDGLLEPVTQVDPNAPPIAVCFASVIIDWKRAN